MLDIFGGKALIRDDRNSRGPVIVMPLDDLRHTCDVGEVLRTTNFIDTPPEKLIECNPRTTELDGFLAANF